MIIWITGNTGAGKTTLARKLSFPTEGLNKKIICLDGNEMRDILGEWDLTYNGRVFQNIKIAKLAKKLSDDGFDVIVSAICPFRSLRSKVKEITDCEFIYVEGGKANSKETPYEIPDKTEIYMHVKGNIK